MAKKDSKLVLLAIVAAGGWYLYQRSKAAAAASTPASSSSSTTAIRSSGASPFVPQITPTPQQPARIWGDPADGTSIAYACNAAFRLTGIGHPNEAAVWIRKCQAAGATVPTSAAEEYA
jgi:hypothetical protein